MGYNYGYPTYSPLISTHEPLSRGSLGDYVYVEFRVILKVSYRMVFRVLGLRVTEFRMVRLWGFSALGCLGLGNIGT